MQPDPGEVVPAKRRARYDAKTVLGEPRDREIALDPTTLVEHLRVCDRADVTSDLVVTQSFEKVCRALPRDLDLGE